MGNFLPKYPKNYFKNQKGLRSFWKMISIGISIIFGILACIDKFEKQWELNVFSLGLLYCCFTFLFIQCGWMQKRKKAISLKKTEFMFLTFWENKPE